MLCAAAVASCRSTVPARRHIGGVGPNSTQPWSAPLAWNLGFAVHVDRCAVRCADGSRCATLLVCRCPLAATSVNDTKRCGEAAGALPPAGGFWRPLQTARAVHDVAFGRTPRQRGGSPPSHRRRIRRHACTVAAGPLFGRGHATRCSCRRHRYRSANTMWSPLIFWGARPPAGPHPRRCFACR